MEIYRKTLNLFLKKVPFYFYVIILVTTVFLAGFNVLLSFIIQKIIDSIFFIEKKFEIYSLILIFLCIFFIISMYFNTYYKEMMNLYVKKNLTDKLLNLNLNVKNMRDNKLSDGKYTTVINEDINNISVSVTQVFLPFVKETMTITFGIVYGILNSWLITLILVAAVILNYIINLKISGKLQKNFEEYQTIQEKEKQFQTDYLNNIGFIKVIKSFESMKRKFNEIFHEKRKYGEKVIAYQAMLGIFSEYYVIFIELAVFLIGIILMNRNILTFGAVVGLWNGLIGSILWPVVEIPYIIEDYSFFKVSWNRLKKVFSDLEYEKNKETEKEIFLSNLNNKENVTENFDDGKLFEMKNLSFYYEKQLILDSINLSIYKNKLNYIIGESGAGKTTLLKLILGFLKLDYGTVVFEKNCNENSIAYIPQEIDLLPVSIAENITFSKTYNKEKMDDILKKVNLFKEIRKTEFKENTVINKLSLSYGQLQRILIARGLYHNKDILLMDEPFSSLDRENEKILTETLNNIKKDKGIVIVAHAPRFVTEDDKIFEIAGGKIYEKQ